MSERPIAARASALRPCPVCGRTSSCSVTDDGLHFCMSNSAGAEWKRIGDMDKQGFYHYRKADNGREKEAKKFVKNLTSERREELANALMLPVASLDALPDLGFNLAEGCWTFPEVDGAGRVIGLMRRYADGRKLSAPGWKRGLTVPAILPSGPLHIVEGATDVLAFTLCGLAAIGRPGARAGLDLLVEFISRCPERKIILCGENDQRPNKKDPTVIDWPGKDGVDQLGPQLANALGRSVWTVFPPAGVKDFRAWVVALVAGTPRIGGPG